MISLDVDNFDDGDDNPDVDEQVLGGNKGTEHLPEEPLDEALLWTQYLRGDEKTRKKQLKRAIDLFNGIESQKPYDELLREDINVIIIGKFVDCLGATLLAYNYVDMLFSAWKCDICDRFYGTEDLVFTRGGTYGRARKKLLSLKTAQCKAKGISIQKSAPRLIVSQIEYFLKWQVLRDDFEMRCVVVWDWASMGRINESQELSLSSIKLYASEANNVRCLEVNWNRTKLSFNHNIFMFLHSKSWLLCPYDALLDYLVNNYESNEQGIFYPNINHVEARINAAIRKCRAECPDGEVILPATTSHFIRRSGMMHANTNDKIKESSVIMHAGLVNIANASYYIINCFAHKIQFLIITLDMPTIQIQGTHLEQVHGINACGE